MKRFPVSGPSITEREIGYVTDAVATAWYSRANEYIERFETAFARALGVKHTVSLPSCTSGLHLALLAAGVGEGDEVVVPECTWIASAAPISYVGATPVFADIERDSWCLSPESFERAITPKTKAVIPVDLYGNVANYAAIEAIARRHGIKVIEDAAEAAGASRGGKPAGSFGDVATFSFHGSKTLTTGEGGLLATNDSALFARVSQLRDHGRKPGDRFFWNEEIGYKYKMSALQAALGLAQLERLPELLKAKREIFAWYREALQGVEGLELNPEPADSVSSYWMVTIVWNRQRYAVTKRELMDRLSEVAVDSRPFFHPLSSLPAYAHLGGERRSANPVAYDIGDRALNLPSALSLTRADVFEVRDRLLGVLRR